MNIQSKAVSGTMDEGIAALFDKASDFLFQITAAHTGFQILTSNPLCLLNYAVDFL